MQFSVSFGFLSSLLARCHRPLFLCGRSQSREPTFLLSQLSLSSRFCLALIALSLGFLDSDGGRLGHDPCDFCLGFRWNWDPFAIWFAWADLARGHGLFFIL